MTDAGRPILIIGRTPPPFGGVTTHVSRLLQALKDNDLPFEHAELSSRHLLKVIWFLLYGKHKLVHIHSSNQYACLLVALLCRVTGKKLIMTIHGDIVQGYTPLKRFLLLRAMKLSSLTITLNESSYNYAMKHQTNARMITSFIPPRGTGIKTKSDSFILREFFTYAHQLSYHNGKEVYGVQQLVDIFSKHANLHLTIIDPSGQYNEKYRSARIATNIKIIDGCDDISQIIQGMDVLIRNTTTDGDSILIKEALFFGKQVIATNCVNRPSSCILVKLGDMMDLEEKIITIDAHANIVNVTDIEDGSLAIIKIYHELLCEAEQHA